ncbi:MAG TPA: pseudouridine synthase, partial [Pirellula sp.]|nr:pseudouridine synthase [Pirellula sp.]
MTSPFTVLSKSIVNIAAYKFFRWDDLEPRRDELKSLCKQLSLRGTILISGEGINLFLAGARESIDSFLSSLRSIPELVDIPVKESLTDYQPFNRMLVRIKREIIPVGVDGVQPIAYASPKLSPELLKQWLDENRPVTLLDTRNDYEVELGTFVNA